MRAPAVPLLMDATLDAIAGMSLRACLMTAPANSPSGPPPERREEDDESRNSGSNLFVTGIHPSLSEEEVTRLFEKYGEVEQCNIMRDPHTKESRGFGFVKMVTSDQADAAKEGLQGEVHQGRTLSIEKARRARPRTPTPGKYYGPPKRGKFAHSLRLPHTDSSHRVWRTRRWRRPGRWTSLRRSLL